jgi:hypothetical protein
MPPKKAGKVEEEAPAPEEKLPAGYSVGCQVYWAEVSRVFEDSGEILKRGTGGTLTAVPELVEFDREDGSKDYRVEVVEVRFEGLNSEPRRVPLAVLSLEPLPLELLDELSTGLRLPLTGRQVEQVWAVCNDLGAQGRLLSQLLALEESYPSPAQRDIVCDYHIFNLMHAKVISFSSLQAAVFVSIMQRMLDMMKIEGAGPNTRPSDGHDVATCFAEFECMILAHSMKGPEKLDIFRGSDVKLLTDFASLTVFKHFLLYQYCMNFPVEVQVTRIGVNVQRPWPLPDLSGATLRASSVPSKHQISENVESMDGASPLKGSGPLTSEEDEIDRLVRQKLQEAEEALDAKLKDREEALLVRAQGMSRSKSPPKKPK